MRKLKRYLPILIAVVITSAISAAYQRAFLPFIRLGSFFDIGENYGWLLIAAIAMGLVMGVLSPNAVIACIASIITVVFGVVMADYLILLCELGNGSAISANMSFVATRMLEPDSIKWHGIQILVAALSGLIGYLLISAIAALRARYLRDNHVTMHIGQVVRTLLLAGILASIILIIVSIYWQRGRELETAEYNRPLWNHTKP